MTYSKSDRLDFSKAFIDRWTDLVLENMESPPLRGTVQKSIEAILRQKLKVSTRQLYVSNDSKHLVRIMEQDLFNNERVVGVVLSILDQDIEEFKKTAPVRHQITLALKSIYVAELGNPGIYFPFQRSQKEHHTQNIPQGLKFWVLDKTLQKERQTIKDLKYALRDKAYDLMRKIGAPNKNSLSLITKSLTLIFASLHDFQEADFFDPKKIVKVKDAFKIVNAGPKTRECALYALRAYEEMLEPPVFKSQRPTQTPRSLSEHGPK